MPQLVTWFWWYHYITRIEIMPGIALFEVVFCGHIMKYVFSSDLPDKQFGVQVHCKVERFFQLTLCKHTIYKPGSWPTETHKNEFIMRYFRQLL